MGSRARAVRQHVHRRFILVVLACLTCAGGARAEVTRVDVTRRTDVGSSGYEKIVGTIHFAVDPKSSRNRLVVDLDKTPTNASGLVEFSSDLYILRPKAPRGNEAALVDILNRGNKVVLNGFNRGASPDPATENDLGDRFLMRFGFTIGWVGWEFDLEDRPMTMKIHVPAAVDQGEAISGVVRATFTPNAKTTDFTLNDLSKYDAVDPAAPTASSPCARTCLVRMARRSTQSVACRRPYGHARQRLRARKDVHDQLSRRSSAGSRPRIRCRPRHDGVVETPAGCARPRSLCLRVRVVAERPFSARVPVRGVQHR
jgi:hypothetical protein